MKFENLQVVAKQGYLVVMNRHGELVLADDAGRERERYALTYGAKLLVEEGQKVPAKTHACPSGIRSRCRSSPKSAASVKFGDIIEGDDAGAARRGHRSLAQGHHRVEGRRHASAYLVKDDDGKTKKVPGSSQEARYFLPVGANIYVNDGDHIEAGDIIAKIPRETTKTKDITGGLPRVAELFEARKPKEHAVISRDRRHRLASARTPRASARWSSRRKSASRRST